MIETPVVVKPDIASKKASLTDMWVDPNMNGIMPNIENTIQVSEVSSMLSRLRRVLVRGCMQWFSRIPVTAVVTAEIRNIIESFSP